MVRGFLKIGTQDTSNISLGPKEGKIGFGPWSSWPRRRNGFQNEKILIHKDDNMQKKRRGMFHSTLICLCGRLKSTVRQCQVFTVPAVTPKSLDFPHQAREPLKYFEKGTDVTWSKLYFSGVRNKWNGRGVSWGQDSQLESLQTELEETNQDSARKEKYIGALWSKDGFKTGCE